MKGYNKNVSVSGISENCCNEFSNIFGDGKEKQVINFSRNARKMV